MKKLISISVLILILFNAGGYFLWYLSVRNEIHNDIKQKIKYEINTDLIKTDLSLIIVNTGNKKDIRWIKSGKEFTYLGEMFDVVKIEIRNQKIYYYCIKDIKEKQLTANFIHIQHSGKKKKLNTNLLNIIYLIPVSDFNTFPILKEINNFNFSFNFVNTVIDIPSPPPKFI